MYMTESPLTNRWQGISSRLLESKGAINSIRWEPECRDEAAERYVRQLVIAGPNWGTVAADRLVAFIDFRDLPRVCSRPTWKGSPPDGQGPGCGQLQEPGQQRP